MTFSTHSENPTIICFKNRNLQSVQFYDKLFILRGINIIHLLFLNSRCRGFVFVTYIYLVLDHTYSQIMINLEFSIHLETRLFGICKSKMYLLKTWALMNVKWTLSQKLSFSSISQFLVRTVKINNIHINLYNVEYWFSVYKYTLFLI